MAVTDPIRPIRELVQGQEDTINRLVATDGEFSGLCEDFDACVEAWRHWSGSDESGARKIADEYREVLADLYDEIQRHLARVQRRAPGRGR